MSLFRTTITFVFLLTSSLSAYAFNLSDLKKETSSDAKRVMNTYVIGAGQGIFWSNVWAEIRGRDKAFCPPKDHVFTGKYFLDLIEEVKVDRSYIGREDTKIESVIFWELEKRFRCTQENRQPAANARSKQSCQDLVGVIKKQLPVKASEDQTVIGAECRIISGQEMITYIYKVDVNTANLEDTKERFRSSASTLLKSTSDRVCKNPNVKLLLGTFLIKYEYINSASEVIGDIIIASKDCD